MKLFTLRAEAPRPPPATLTVVHRDIKPSKPSNDDELFRDSLIDKVTSLLGAKEPEPIVEPSLVMPRNACEIVGDMSSTAYHADPGEVPTLSHSIAHIIDRQSPAHAHAFHPRYGKVQRRAKSSLSRGTKLHAILLGDESQFCVVGGKGSKSKAQAAIARGEIPVSAREYDELRAASLVLLQRFADHGYDLAEGQSEASVFWSETSGRGGLVPCRARLDHLQKRNGGITILDLKNIRSADKKTCAKHVDLYGYAIQRATYVSALEHVFPALAGRVDFKLLFFEDEPPYVVTPGNLNGQFRYLGEQAWKRAVNVWEACTRANRWPGYVAEGEPPAELEPPPWTVAGEAERQAEYEELLSSLDAHDESHSAAAAEAE